MASTTVLFLLSVFLLANEIAAHENNSSIISLGSSLSPNTNRTSWVSTSGLFAFGFYREGNGFAVGTWLVGKPENTIVWTYNRDDPPLSSDSRLELTTDGRLVLQTEQEKDEIYADYLNSVTSASMLDSGNFVLYGNISSVVWQTFDIQTDTILGGQNLSTLVSSRSKSDHSSGYFTFSRSYGVSYSRPYGRSSSLLYRSPYSRSDGRLSRDSGKLIARPTNASDDAYLTFDGFQIRLTVEGVLLLIGDDDHVLANGSRLTKKSKNIISVYRATLDIDGVFRLYVHQFEGNTSLSMETVWSAPSNPCEVTGYCGLNSYCSNTDNNTVCLCFPGFNPPSEHSNLFLVCKENHTNNECESSADPKVSYKVVSLEDTVWDGYPYSVINMKKEACERSCQEDCDCGAGLYNDGNCKKYKLPLRHGKRIQNASATAFFKLPSGNIIPLNRSNTPTPEMKPEVIIDNKRSLILILVLTLGSISFFMLAFAISVCFTYRRHVYRYTKLSESANLGFTEECTLRPFSFDELLKSTGGFTEEIGRGSFGAVYRGTLPGSNRSIAVKRLERIVEEGEREFRAEITAIARTHHRNLVQLIGFCIEGSRKLLVYEYMSNGSLADLLFKAEMSLSWRERVRIALEVARGVLYLHEECEFCIIHCNIKPQNILMDEAWTAKISDFGWARLLMPNHSRSTRELEGTSGYLPPEWQKDASVSVKADIYSYGVTLLEIICSRRNIDVNVSSAEEIILSSWVSDCFVKGELNKLVAAEDIDLRTLERMVKVGLWCVQEDPNLRPTMKNTILMLEGLKDIPIPPSPTPAV